MLANNWSVKRKSTRTPVLETTDGSAEIKVPIDLAMADYESRMAEALSELCSCEGNGTGVIEARDLLIPQLKRMGIGWNGNFGISNAGLAYNSKLAYEILKTIRYTTEKRDSSVLKVTNEPLPHVEGSFQIKAL